MRITRCEWKIDLWSAQTTSSPVSLPVHNRGTRSRLRHGQHHSGVLATVYVHIIHNHDATRKTAAATCFT